MTLTSRQRYWLKAAKDAKRDGNGAALLFAFLAYPATDYPLKEPKNSNEVSEELRRGNANA